MQWATFWRHGHPIGKEQQCPKGDIPIPSLYNCKTPYYPERGWLKSTVWFRCSCSGNSTEGGLLQNWFISYFYASKIHTEKYLLNFYPFRSGSFSSFTTKVSMWKWNLKLPIIADHFSHKTWKCSEEGETSSRRSLPSSYHSAELQFPNSVTWYLTLD